MTWDLKTGELASRWNSIDNKSQVTKIVRSAVDHDVFAVGYEDGKIRVWDSQTATVIIVFNGHRSAITELEFDNTGTRLVSGAKDSDIICWDLVGEVGLCKLRGHKDQITSLKFLSLENEFKDLDTGSGREQMEAFLLSTSKDGLIKLWDLSTQTCVETHVAQSNGECWALTVLPDGSGCISGGNEGELRVWSINSQALARKQRPAFEPDVQVLQDRGSFYRHGKDRVTEIRFHPQKEFFAVHGPEKAIELWRIRSGLEIQKNMARKRKRRRENGQEDLEENEPTGSKNDIGLSAAHITDVFASHAIVRTRGRVRSVDWAGGTSSKSITILVATTNNQLELYDVNITKRRTKNAGEEIPDYQRISAVEAPGHRSDIRCLAISSDDRMLASASQESLKIWNLRTHSCIRTLECGYALCCTFLPGDKIVVIGTRNGKLEVFDIASSTMIERVDAHEKDIWSFQVSPDGKSLVTGSADKSIKFWQFKVIQEEVLGTGRKAPKLTLLHMRTLKVADDVLSVRFSPDGKLLAVGSLDNTVKIFFVDTLRLYLTLYGHKLPVLSIDISYDNKLIATSSADKNVRIWGLDFGDCHKAFFAHQDSILAVGFVPNNDEGRGHYFFSASKDGKIKYFDGDKFELIQKLEGHHGEIWTTVMTHSGSLLVSASHDKSIRVWQQTEEQIFPEEEREKDLEELYESTLITALEQDDFEGGAQSEQDQVLAPGKQTAQTLMAGERITEAIQLGMEDLAAMTDRPGTAAANSRASASQRNAVFLANNNISASDYVLQTFRKIPFASLHDALLVLSFSQLPALFTFLHLWASEGRDIVLTCRVLFFLLKTHQRQIVNNQLTRKMLEDVRNSLRQTLRQQKGEIGFNLAGTSILRRHLAEMTESALVDLSVIGLPDQSKKRAFVNVS